MKWVNKLDSLVLAFIKGKYCVIENNWILFSSCDDQSARRYYYSCKRNPELIQQSYKRQPISFDDNWYSKEFWIDSLEGLKDRYGEYSNFFIGFIIIIFLSIIFFHTHTSQHDIQISEDTVIMEALDSTVENDDQPGIGSETRSKSKKKTPEQLYHPLIVQASQRYDVDQSLIKAIIKAESSYNPNAVSKVGAQGLMQLMPNTAKELGVENSFDPKQNIDGGVRYFKKLLDKYNGNKKLALAAYNAGSAKVKRYRGVPPYKATKLYIKKVCWYEKQYKKQTRTEITKA